ncbi:MAG: hypothetical protein JJ964_00355 [Rhizobiales bacterium]|nr:hypothetical protein [Hyphomicrobiales bacterium]
MKENDLLFLEQFTNSSTYPLLNQDSQNYKTLIKNLQSDLNKKGCAVLKGFIKPKWHAQIENEGELVAPLAYYKQETVNAYNVPLNSDLPEDHPAKITMQRENAFVAKDLIPETDIIHRLYNNELFSRFLANCFNYEKLYQLADPLAGLCVNVLNPGCSHPWHYDINEFTVSLLTKKPEAGGNFRYSPGIRTPGNENLSEVKNILLNGDNPHNQVTDLSLEVGDLQLFKGRYSLHQVSPVKGEEQRHTAIFAYTLEPGVIGGVERTKQLFGRALEAHEIAEREKVRADELLD